MIASGLSEIATGKEISGNFIGLLRAWSPSLDVEQYLSDLKLLREPASRFLETCQPTPASEITANSERIGERTVTRANLAARLGKVLGDMIFEVLAAAHGLKSRILTFGDRLGDLLHRAGFLVISLHHKLKDELKKRSHTKTALRIAVWVFSVGAANYMVNLIPGIPSGDLDMILRGLASLGLSLAGDKLADVIERGIVVFLDGTAYYPTGTSSQLRSVRS